MKELDYCVYSIPFHFIFKNDRISYRFIEIGRMLLQVHEKNINNLSIDSRLFSYFFLFSFFGFSICFSVCCHAHIVVLMRIVYLSILLLFSFHFTGCTRSNVLFRWRNTGHQPLRMKNEYTTEIESEERSAIAS